MRKKRVFVSFDFDNDSNLKEFFVSQSKLEESPFEITDHSLIEAAPHWTWVVKTTNAIRRSETVVVVVGAKTYCAPGVLREIAIARREEKRVIQIAGYKSAFCRSVGGAGFVYEWSWANLKKLLDPSRPSSHHG